MKIVQAFETADGKLFKTEAEAKTAEAKAADVDRKRLSSLLAAAGLAVAAPANLGGLVKQRHELVCALFPQGLTCMKCGSTEDVYIGPDPYQSEINNDETLVMQCASCRNDSAMEI